MSYGSGGKLGGRIVHHFLVYHEVWWGYEMKGMRLMDNWNKKDSHLKDGNPFMGKNE